MLLSIGAPSPCLTRPGHRAGPSRACAAVRPGLVLRARRSLSGAVVAPDGPVTRGGWCARSASRPSPASEVGSAPSPRISGDGPLAQSAELRTFNPLVVGSSPTGPTPLTSDDTPPRPQASRSVAPRGADRGARRAVRPRRGSRARPTWCTAGHSRDAAERVASGLALRRLGPRHRASDVLARGHSSRPPSRPWGREGCAHRAVRRRRPRCDPGGTPPASAILAPVLTQYCPIETAAEIVDPRTSHGSGRAVEYRLTEAGRELEPGLMALGVGSP